MGCVQRMLGTQEALYDISHEKAEVSQLSQDQEQSLPILVMSEHLYHLFNFTFCLDTLVRCPYFQRPCYPCSHSGSQDFLSMPCLALWEVLSKQQRPNQSPIPALNLLLKSPVSPDICFFSRSTQVPVNCLHPWNQRGSYLHGLLQTGIDCGSNLLPWWMLYC